MASHRKTPPHFVLLPAMAQGHMIPLVDTGRLLAARGVVVTILVTPQNGKRIKRVVHRASDSGLSICISHLKLAYAEAGLPEGCDSTDKLPSAKYMINFARAAEMLRGQVKEILQNLQYPPSCVIADAFFPWATDVAREFHIPRLVFHVSSVFALVCSQFGPSPKDVSDTIEIPPDWVKLHDAVKKAEDEAFGMVANTFEELEDEYVKRQMKVTGKKVWCVGPVSLCNRDDSDKAERGTMASVNKQDFLNWLGAHECGSVVYVCFGSTPDFSIGQLIELGLGLEASNRAFIWVIRNAPDVFRKWLVEERFEERVNGRGLLIQGWAPQVLILSHPSVGGFVTHCGWNSLLEGFTAGLPMITWPISVEQFRSEKFVLNVTKTGISVGVEKPVTLGLAEEVGVQVRREDVKMAIDRLMDGGREGRERRERARKLREMAKRAVEEGGSSYNNMTQLIEEVTMYQAKHGD